MHPRNTNTPANAVNSTIRRIGHPLLVWTQQLSDMAHKVVESRQYDTIEEQGQTAASQYTSVD